MANLALLGRAILYATTVTSVSAVAAAATVPMPQCSPAAVISPPGPAGPAPAIPAGPLSFQVVAQYGGRPQAIAATSSRVYAGIGRQLVVLDVADPLAPKEVGASDPLPGALLDIALTGNVAYVAAADAGLVIIDLGDGTRPRVIGHADTPGYAEGIAVEGTRAYLADGPGGLRVFDISDSSRPRQTSSAFSQHNVLAVAVSGERAFLAAGGAGLLVADVSGTSAVEIGRAESAGFAWGIAVDGDVAWVADGWAGITTFDVQRPWRPVLLSSLATSGWSMDIDRAGSLLLSASARGGTDVLDVSAPMEPRLRGNARTFDGHAHRVTHTGSRAVIADRNRGIELLEITAPAGLSKLATWTPLGFADGVAVEGNLAWVAADSFGVAAIDLTTGREVVRLSVPERSFAKNVSVSGTSVFVTPQFNASLGVIDASDLSKASINWYQWAFGTARNHARSGGMLVIPMEWGLRIQNVSDPRAPCELAFMSFTGSGPTSPGPSTGPVATGIALSGTYGFVTASSHGLWVVDLSDPRNPRKVADSPDELDGNKLFYEDLALYGSYVYAYSHTYDRAVIRVIDVSDPLHPVRRGASDVPIGVQGWGPFLAATPTTVFVADRTAGLIAVDVRDPDRPVLAGRYALPAAASSVVVSGNRIYVTADDAGLFVLEATSASAAPRATEASVAPHPDRRVASSGRTLPLEVEDGVAPRPDNRIFADATCTVSSPADNGAGTLRDCMTRAVAGTTILFDPAVFPPTAPASINVTTELPQLSTGGVTIDASNAGVILDGSSAPAGTSGIRIRSDGNRISGLQIVRFSGDGITLRGVRNTIGGGRSRGRGPSGEGNVISGNGVFGVRVGASRLGEPAENRIVGNLIGLDVTGTAAMGNGLEGISLLCDGNLIGGISAEERNVIAASGETDVHISGRGLNRIAGNYIGTDLTGNVRLSNPGYWSVSVEGGAFANTIESNVVVGGIQTGIAVTDAGSSYNQVVGNKVGLNAAGTEALGGGGIIMSDDAFNRIERNAVTATIDLWNRATMNVVAGNTVGTDAGATRPLGTGPTAITIRSSHNFIGGSGENDANIISGRIRVHEGSSFNVITGNALGTDLTATRALARPGPNGIELTMADGNAVQGNVIASPRNSAILARGGAQSNWIHANQITRSRTGIDLADSSANVVHANTLAQNDTNAADGGTGNQWDDGVRGNYWSDYTGRDDDGDGAGDVPRAVPPNGVDRFPLLSPTPPSPAPSIAGIAPNGLDAGSGAFTLVVTGSGFVRGSSILWNGIPLKTTYVSAARLDAEVAAGRLSVPARIAIAVVSPSPGGGTSSDLYFGVRGDPRGRTVRR